MMIQNIRKYYRHYLVLLPFFVLYTAFFLWPMAYSLVMSFTNWSVVRASEYVGFQNYIDVVTSPRFQKAALNVVKYVIVRVPLGIAIPLVLALLLDRFRRGGGFFRTAYFLPVVIPMFAVALVWRWILAPQYGLMNRLLLWLGFESIHWLRNPKYMMPAVIMINIWRSVGFNLILLLAGLKGIPKVYYEAARVDGAKPWQEALYIAIPQLEPVLFLVIVNDIIGTFQVFDLPWLLSSSGVTSGVPGGPQQAILFPVMDMMSRAFGSGLKFGEASAYGIILLVVIMAFTVIQFRLRRYFKWTD
jgi:multiple sugar transport system permease protein